MNRPLIGMELLVTMVFWGGVVFSGCSFQNYDYFSNTKSLFLLDKDQYFVGDTITLTLELRGESTVRFYENIENTLKVWLALRVSYQGENTTVTNDGIRSEAIELRNRGNIETYKLEKSKPLLLEFYGSLQETDAKDAFLIVFPRLNKRFIVSKNNYANALSLDIRGHLTPINRDPRDSLEDYVGGVRLSIQS